MATEKPRFSVTFSDDSFMKIQKFKEENNISTQSKAVAKLVELAINELEEAKKISPSTAEAALGEDVQKMLEILDSSLVQMGYITAGDDLTEQQQEVLLGICGILRATFKKK